MGKYSICLIVMQFMFLTISAQRLYSPEYRSPLLDKWRITHIEELKDKSIFDMDVSPDGTMFFTGKRNFYRYDGYNWESLLPDSLSKKIGWAVTNIIHAHGGAYLLQLNALKFYKDGTYTNLLERDGIEAKFFYTNMLLLSNNNLIVSSGLGLYYFTPEQTYFYGDRDNLGMIKEAYPSFTVLP
ncbi:MAG: hypothetical protein MI922_24765, partial [Bacteroidales bacterium]|nr:hypothetical protein [Bacteroidales bacterium]